MGCFGCSKKSSKRSETNKDTVINRKIVGGTTSVAKSDKRDDQTQPSSDSTKVSPYRDVNNEGGVGKEDQLSLDVKGLNLNDQVTGKKAQTFTFQELAEATGNFRSDCFLGEGGFGKVFKGTIEKLDQVVAIKQLDRNGVQGIREFVVEVLTLSLADHPNLVKLIGFCAEGDQRLLVYEYMPQGSLEDHLHVLPSGKKPLDWNTRMKIAAGAARGLEYLHDRMTPPVIYRDLKCSNILLGEDYQPKLSDFGLAKVGPSGDKTHVSTRVMGTYGYCAPDYAMTGQLTFKSDIYSFGVVLLELITGRKAIDNTKTRKDQNLVGWARPLFKDRRNFPKMVDPLLQGQYPVRGLYQALAISAMCVQEQPSMRPVVSDVVLALNFLASSKYDPNSPSSSSRKNPSFHRDRDDEEKRPHLVKETECEGRTGNTRRGIFPVSEYWIHAIPVIVFLCFFTLWIFSHSVSVMNDGEIMSIHRLEKSMAVRNESHVSLAILASSAVSPASSALVAVVSTNQNLTTQLNRSKMQPSR
ncbi:putative protein kinase RLK-Pelle-RLCK-VIIa-1 family [Arabidopsis thaliana]|uniref:Protein kinase domain-containing protein n=1 Tax=Arabidopsis thaliana TaxID=3702 RepID=A0A654E7N9_ARATH|nr:unnamed protein product [Arabidopsis thaliana]